MTFSDYSFNLPSLDRAIDRNPITVSPDTLLANAIGIMASASNVIEETLFAAPDDGLTSSRINTSCVLVMEAGQILGVFTQRDAVRAVISQTIDPQQVKIAELMTKPAIALKIAEGQDIFTPLLFFRQHNIRHLPILDRDEGKLMGMITPKDILQTLQPHNLFKLGTVGEVMNTQVVYASRNTSLLTIAQIMLAEKVSCVVITDERENRRKKEFQLKTYSVPIGIITEKKILQALAMGKNLVNTPAFSAMRCLGYQLNPANSLLTAYQQMLECDGDTLLVFNDRKDSHEAKFGIITEMELLRSLEPGQIYQRLKRAQQSVRQLQAEKTALLQRRNAELEQEVQQQTAQLWSALNQVEQQAKQAATINQIVQAMRGSLVLDEVLQTTANQLHEALDVNFCLIYRPDPKVCFSVQYASENTPKRDNIIGLKCDFCTYYHSELVQGKELILNQISGNIPLELQQKKELWDIHSLLLVPLIYGNSYLGGISLSECGKDRQWTADEVQFVKAIADHCAIAIHQAELYQQMQAELLHRQKIEQQLRWSEELFRQIAENIHQVFYVKDIKQDKIIYVSPAYEEIWGESRHILYEQPRAFLNAVHPEDLDRAITLMENFPSENSDNQEYRIIRPDGQVRWVWNRAFPLKNQLGEIYRIAGIIEDITALKQAEINLKEQKQFLRTVIDATPNLIFVKDEEGKFILTNQVCADFYGTTIEEMSSKTDADFNPIQSQFDHYRRDDLEVMTTLQPKFIPEEPLTNATGEVRWLQTIKKPLASPDGRVRQVLGVCTDITERKLAEEALQKTNEQLQAVLDAVPGFVSWMNSDGEYLGVNSRLAQAYKLPPESFIGKKIGFFTNKSEYVDFITDFLAKPDRTADRVIDSNVNGKKHSHLIVAQKYQQNYATVTVGIDITDRKQAEEALQEREALLETVVSNAPIVLYALNKAGIFTFIAGKGLKCLGLQPKEVVGKSIFEDDREYPLISENNLSILSGEELSWIANYQDRVFDNRSRPLFDENRELKGTIGVAWDITERVRTEQILQERERLFRAIFNNAFQFTEMLTPDGIVLEANQTVLDFGGLELSDVVGIPFWETRWCMLSKETQKKVKNAIERAAKGEFIRYETDILGAGDRVATIDFSLKPIFDADGVVVRLLAEGRDITEQKRAQAERDRFFNNSMDLMAIADFQGILRLVNPAWEKNLGFTKEELESKHYSDFIHPDDLNSSVYIFEEAIALGEPLVGLENRFLGKNGSYRWLSWNMVLFPTENLAYIFARDITERKLAEASLQASEARFRSLSECSPVGIFMSDGDRRFIYTNPRCQVICGFTFQEALGEDWAQFIHPDEREMLYQNWSQHAHTKQEYFYEHRWLQKDGTKRWVQVRTTPLFLNNEQAIVYVGTIQDITESKQAQEKIKASLQEKEVLLKEVHHRVKNNLQIIYSLLDLQSQQLPRKNQSLSKANLSEIFQASKNRVKCMALIHERLYQSENMALINFADYIETLAYYLLQAYAIAPDKIKLILNLDRQACLNIDTAIPCGLITNELIGNALKHAFPENGGGTIMVEFKCLGDNQFYLKIQDDGVRAPNFSELQSQSNLGFKLVNILVRQLDGSLEINQNFGSAFTIRFKDLKY